MKIQVETQTTPAGVRLTLSGLELPLDGGALADSFKKVAASAVGRMPCMRSTCAGVLQAIAWNIPQCHQVFRDLMAEIKEKGFDASYLAR
jgi:hypothetical protein